MQIKNEVLTIFAVLLCLTVANKSFSQPNTFPDYAETFLGVDKHENFNRKMFAFNLGLNKYAIRPIHVVWSSIMPKYGMDKIQNAYANIEYPKRVMSCLIQGDFKASKTETKRFLVNTTIGLGGLFDPAKTLLKIEPVDEDVEQALSRCRIKPGSYLVLPILSSTSPRNITGKIFDWALNPTAYAVTPALAAVKAGLTVNRTSYMQPLIKMVESTYADPYDIAKKVYGIERYIKCANLDRREVIDNITKQNNESEDKIDSVRLLETEKVGENLYEVKNAAKDDKQKTLTVADILKGGANVENVILKNYNSENSKLLADVVLFDYNPQTPVIDAMRTALFDLPGIKNSIWGDFSIWNRCFEKKVKTSSVSLFSNRRDYGFKYIMQKDKNAPVVVIYPSIGEGITSYHSVVIAKVFYDLGYSAIIQGSHFQWEFVKSMPKGYRPGIPSQDTDYLRMTTAKIIDKLQSKYDCKFSKKVLIGTSFGAFSTLFVAEREAKENTLDIAKYISVCPPVELIYAMTQVDKNSSEWHKNENDLRNKVAVTAAKVIQTTNDVKEKELKSLPFSDDEAKLITGFVMHQKLSDLIFAIDENSRCKNCYNSYKNINSMGYGDYAEKYLMNEKHKNISDLVYETSLYPIFEYLRNNNNYKIYHSINDYLTNQTQLKELKKCSGAKTVLFDNGSHLGFLYRKEFIEDLKRSIVLK